MRLAFLSLLLLSCSTAHSSNGSKAEHNAAPVLVELFTSQGCSSCPPADELLRGIDEKTDVDVIALSFHVDYWDYIGWRDPYSSPEATRRQQAYAAKIAGGRSYTPQLVVGGETHVLGSSEKKAVAAIERASKRKHSALSLSTTLASKKKGKLEVQLEAIGSLEGKRLYLAIYESGLTTKVVRGENAGRKIRNDYVVRRLSLAHAGSNMISLDASWDASKLGIVAFAQDKKSLRIEAVHRLPF